MGGDRVHGKRWKNWIKGFADEKCNFIGLGDAPILTSFQMEMHLFVLVPNGSGSRKVDIGPFLKTPCNYISVKSGTRKFCPDQLEAEGS